MEKTPTESSNKNEQRRLAEAKLSARQSEMPIPSLNTIEVQHLVHELQVHQIELEMQNEALIQARAELEKLLHEFTDLYNFTPVGYFTLARDGVIHQINPAGVALLGLTPAQIVHHRLVQFIDEPSRVPFSDFLDKVFATNEQKETCEVTVSQAESVPLWAYLEAVSCAKYEVCHVAMVDLSEHKRTQNRLQAEIAEREHAETRLEEAVLALKNSNMDLEQYAYAVSHDLQEPLRQIIILTQLIDSRYKGKLGSDGDEIIAYIVDGAHRMNEMVKGLLEYSRISRRAPQFVPVDCNYVLSSALANLQVPLKDHQGSVAADSLPTIFGEKVLLIQVFQNLLANALKFHQPNQPPQIHISAEKYVFPPTVRPRDQTTNEPDLTSGQWLFSVRDNGIGIPKEYFDRIFIIFQRLHTHTEYPGTGIGLTLTKRIIERHGGQIWLESQEGVGTTFYFTLPEVPASI